VPGPFRRIGVCIDDSDAARLALGTARSLAGPDAALTLLHVVEPPSLLVELAVSVGGGVPPDTEAPLAAAEAWLDSLREGGEEAVVLSGGPVDQVVRWAEESGCDLLVTATRRDHVRRSLLGSFTQRLTAGAPCSTLLVHPPRPADAAG